MSRELLTNEGKRKYLTPDERAAFLKAAAEHPRREVRSFCEILAFTGCRISEALALTPSAVDLSAKTITFKTLKQRGRLTFRSVPVPDELINTLDLAHGIRKASRRKGRGVEQPIWNWSRVYGFRQVKAVLDQASIEGPHASPKGLRHAFGILAAAKTRNPRLVQKWLGHRSLETTTIYMDAVGAEEREAASAMW